MARLSCVAQTKQNSLVFDAIRQTLAVLEKAPISEEVRRLREECLAYRHIAERWAEEPPTLREREELMKQVLSLQLAATRIGRTSRPPPASD
jgi:hypothetical protein